MILRRDNSFIAICEFTTFEDKNVLPRVLNYVRTYKVSSKFVGQFKLEQITDSHRLM